MDTLTQFDKEKKHVTILSWILIIGSALILLKTLLLINGYSSMIKLQSATNDFNPPVQINFTLYFISNAIELLLSIIVFVAAVFVLQYKNLWRKVLITGLIASIVFLLVSPIINFSAFQFPHMVMMKGMDRMMLSSVKTSMLIWSYFWSIVMTIFFIFVIKTLSKKEVQKLFQ